MAHHHRQIGEVAERTGLSLRTIRYYEEVGLITPSARSQGGFRLYTEEDIARLGVVKAMKPLDFSLDEMRGLLDTLDALSDDATDPARRGEALEQLDMFQGAAEERCRALRRQLSIAEGFADQLSSLSTQHKAANTPT